MENLTTHSVSLSSIKFHEKISQGAKEGSLQSFAGVFVEVAYFILTRFIFQALNLVIFFEVKKEIESEFSLFIR